MALGTTNPRERGTLHFLQQPLESNIDYWILKCSQRLFAKYIQNVKEKPISF
jgi:hypothetical protein